MKTTKCIEQLWRVVYASGIGDPLKGLNLISYLFILKGIEERSRQPDIQDTTFSSEEANMCSWSTIKAMAHQNAEACYQHLRTNVGAWLRSLDPESCLEGASSVFAQLLPSALYRLMETIEGLCQQSLSTKDAFETVLIEAEKEGAFQPKAGQIMTPLHIASLMADLVCPQPTEKIMDMSCGTGNLLVAAWQYMRRTTTSFSWLLPNGQMLFESQKQQKCTASLFGYDINPMILPPCYAHLLLCGIDQPHVRCSDALGSTFNRRLTRQYWGNIDVVLGNPPFNGFLDVPDLGETLRQVGTQDTELLFLELTMQLLREGGRAALLLPEGVVRNMSVAAIAIRRKLVCQNQLLAVISLPQGIFLPHANIKTTLLLFRKGKSTSEDIFFYRVTADGYTPDTKRRETPTTTDLWDLRFQYAAAFGLAHPVWGSDLLQQDWWEQYISDKHYPGTRYIVPEVEETNVHPITGEHRPPFHRITGFAATSATVAHSWFVSVEEMKANHYSLCADTYREKANTQFHIGKGRKNF